MVPIRPVPKYPVTPAIRQRPSRQALLEGSTGEGKTKEAVGRQAQETGLDWIFQSQRVVEDSWLWFWWSMIFLNVFSRSRNMEIDFLLSSSSYYDDYYCCCGGC